MATKPTNTGSWTASGVEPSGAKKTTGWTQDEKPPYQYFNWFWTLISSWFAWIIEQITGADDSETVSSATTMQAYIDSLEHIINHTITISMTGSNYNNQTITISNKSGHGEIIIQEDGVAPTEYLESIILDNVKCKVSINGIRIDGQTTSTGIDVTECPLVLIDGVTFVDCDPQIIESDDNSVVVCGQTTANIISTGNSAGLLCRNNSIIYSYDWTQSTLDFTDWALKATTGGTIHICADNQPITPSSNAIRLDTGGKINGYYDFNSGTDAADVTLTVAGTNITSLQSYINSVGKYIPYGKTLTLNIGDSSATPHTENIVISDFYGGGTLALQGAGVGTTVLTSSAPVIIQGNTVNIDIQDIEFDSAGNSAGVSILYNPGYVYITDCAVTKGATNGTAIIITNSPNVVLGTINIENGSKPAIGVSSYMSKVSVGVGVTGAPSVNDVSASVCSLVFDGNGMTGAGGNSVDGSSFINKA